MLRIEEIVGAMDDEFRYALDALSDDRLAQLAADKSALRRLRPVGVSHAEALEMIAAIQANRANRRRQDEEAALRKLARREKRKAAPRRKKAAPPPELPQPPELPKPAAALPAPPPPPCLPPPAAMGPAIRLPPPAEDGPPIILPAPRTEPAVMMVPAMAETEPAPPPSQSNRHLVIGSLVLAALAAVLLATL